VEVTVKNGVTYEGIFHSASPQDDMGVCLKMARMKMPSEPSTNGAATKKNTNPLIRNLVILGKDVCSFSCTSVDFTATAKAAREPFATDTSISGATGDVRERELQKWISVEGEALEGDMDLDGAAKARGGKDTAWDQFTINEKLFGVTTDFKEELYTTTIDKDDPEYEKKAAIADRLAREIEKTATTNLHVAEERNQVVIEDGTTFAADEEDRYGAVLRYVPPQVRAKQAGLSAATGPRSVSTNSPAPVSATASLSLSTPTTKDKPSPEATVKHEVVSKFREFSAKEKQSLMERKQLLMKKEKHGILSEFKQFSVSFKLSTPPPEDLLPILRKEGAKSAGELKLSDEGLASGSNEAAAKVEKNDGKDVPKAEKKGADEKEASPVVKPAATEGEAPLEASKSPSPTPTTTSEVTTSSEKKSDFKFNVDAMEFKMNPGAVEFVPGGAAPNNAGYSKSPGQPDKVGILKELIMLI
ncbi:LsmAD domain-containing protein, partial [Cladochytrium replicatum]